MASLPIRVVSVGILTILHAMTFADRYSVAGALGPLVDYYGIDNSKAGLIQTLFLAATIFGAPIAGYFAGVLVWILVMIGSSFIPKNMFWLFLALRCVDGLSENFVYACAPSMIADYFQGQARSYAYMFFYYAINVGSAFGVMVGSAIADKTYWQWALRFVPAITIAAWVGLLLFVQEPKREAEAEQKSFGAGIWEDVKHLMTIKTFILQCLAASMINFTTGAQGWWNAAIIYYAIDYEKKSTDFQDIFHSIDYKSVMLITGCIGIAATISGVSFAVFWAESPNQTIAGAGDRLQSVPRDPVFLFDSVVRAVGCVWATQFVGGFFMGAAFVLNLDILYSVTSASRRATSIMMWSLVQHLLGDGPSPYITGAVADSFRGQNTDSKSEMWALINAFFITNAFTIPAALIHFLIAYTMISDIEKKEEIEKNGCAVQYDTFNGGDLPEKSTASM